MPKVAPVVGSLVAVVSFVAIMMAVASLLNATQDEFGADADNVNGAAVVICGGPGILGAVLMFWLAVRIMERFGARPRPQCDHCLQPLPRRPYLVGVMRFCDRSCYAAYQERFEVSRPWNGGGRVRPTTERVGKGEA